MGYNKAIESGTLLEIYEYEKNLPPKKISYTSRKRIRKPTKRRSDNIHRLRKSFTRLVRSNIRPDQPPYLLSITFVQVIPIKEAYARLSRYVERLRLRFGTEFRYIAVPEFQKRGAVHFHMLLWIKNDEIIKNEKRLRYCAITWGYGFVDVIKTDGSIKLAGYLAKYMSKALHDQRLSGQKAYSTSRNIMRPMSYTFTSLADHADIIDRVDKLSCIQREFDTEWLGRCVYRSYKLNDKT